jgi:hypothetical protein
LASNAIAEPVKRIAGAVKAKKRFIIVIDIRTPQRI